jgi:hypothetical protein
MQFIIYHHSIIKRFSPSVKKLDSTVQFFDTWGKHLHNLNRVGERG